MLQFPWKPLRLLSNLDEQIDRAFDELIHHQWGHSVRSAGWQPDIDVYETEEAYLVEADVPGVPLKEIRVDVEDHWLTISGSRRSATVTNSAQGVRIERRTGSFSRRFYLERAVEASQIQREHEEGMLRLRLPKRRPAEGPRERQLS